MDHLKFTAAQLWRAYRRADSQPCAGTWRRAEDDWGSSTYRCPLNVLYGVRSVADAVDATHAPRACIAGFILGWDGADLVDPLDCKRCYQRGAKLRVELNPTWIGK
jgi:hypothetical protein